jgi:ferredoxin--NADP+ reductase
VSFLIPQRLETEHLVLRIFVQDDWRALHEYYSDVESTRFTFHRTLSEGGTWRAMASMVGHWQLRGYGPYALVEKSTQAVVGTVGLWYPPEWPEPEIKWALMRRCWGKGYAREAVRAIQKMAQECIPDLSLISFIDRENAASIKLALAVGAHFERELEFAGGLWQIYRHPVANTHTAILMESSRITPSTSREEVRHLVFSTGDLLLDGALGNCVRVLAPSRSGNSRHARLYSIMDLERHDEAARFSICVRRCFSNDDASGEESKGVASNYLCDMQLGDVLNFAGPVSYPFAIPDDKSADILMLGMGTGIAPFRALIRRIYDEIGGWKGRVRLYYGAKSPLEMLYMNEENNDLANYFDQPTFKAFQAVSPQPYLDVPAALDTALDQNAAEVWEMINRRGTRVFVAGTANMLDNVDRAMVKLAGSADKWIATRTRLVSSGRWNELLY